MQRWGRFRHHTVATARKASLKQLRGRMVQNSTRLGRAPCWVCCRTRLRPTGGGFVGPPSPPRPSGDVALPEHSVPLSLHVLLVRAVLPLNEVGLPRLPGPVVPHTVLPSAAAAVWHRIGPMESTYGPPAPRSGALSGAAAGMGGWAKAPPWARRWERAARSTLHAAVVARRGEFRQGRGKVLLRLSVRHQGRRAGAAGRSVTCRAGRLGAGPDSPTPPPTHPSPWGWAVGVGGWGGWRGWGRPGQGWAGRCPGLGGYPSSPGWAGGLGGRPGLAWARLCWVGPTCPGLDHCT